MCHQPDEYIEIADVENAAKYYKNIILNCWHKGRTMDVFFYEAFEEEEQAIKRYLPADIKAGFSWKTIQEYGRYSAAATIISIRTQSIIPIEWASQIISHSEPQQRLRSSGGILKRMRQFGNSVRLSASLLQQGCR